MTLLWIGAGLLVIMMMAAVFATGRDAVSRRSDLLPSPGRATMADVERLARAGQKIDAIRCYREIHKVGLAEAKKAVEDLYSRPNP